MRGGRACLGAESRLGAGMGALALPWETLSVSALASQREQRGVFSTPHDRVARF